MAFLVFLLFCASVYANNPIRAELEQLSVGDLLANQKKLDQVEIDLYYKKQNERAIDYKRQYENQLNKWNKAELTLLNIDEKIKEKFRFKGDWGKVKIKVDPQEDFKNVDVEYEYGF